MAASSLQRHHLNPHNPDDDNSCNGMDSKTAISASFKKILLEGFWITGLCKP